MTVETEERVAPASTRLRELEQLLRPVCGFCYRPREGAEPAAPWPTMTVPLAWVKQYAPTCSGPADDRVVELHVCCACYDRARLAFWALQADLVPGDAPMDEADLAGFLLSELAP